MDIIAFGRLSSSQVVLLSWNIGVLSSSSLPWALLRCPITWELAISAAWVIVCLVGCALVGWPFWMIPCLLHPQRWQGDLKLKQCASSITWTPNLARNNGGAAGSSARSMCAHFFFQRKFTSCRAEMINGVRSQRILEIGAWWMIQPKCKAGIHHRDVPRSCMHHDPPKTYNYVIISHGQFTGRQRNDICLVEKWNSMGATLLTQADSQRD